MSDSAQHTSADPGEGIHVTEGDQVGRMEDTVGDNSNPYSTTDLEEALPTITCHCVGTTLCLGSLWSTPNITLEGIRRTILQFPEMSPCRIGGSLMLAIALERRYMDLKQLNDLNVSIDLREQIAALLKTKTFENEDKTTWLLSRTFAQLSFVLFTRHENTGNTEDLDRAIEVQRESLRLAKEQEALSWWSLGHCLMARVGCTKCGQGGPSPVSIDEAVEAFEQGMSHAQPGDPATTPCIIGLARALHFRFKLTKRVEDLERSIETFKRVTILTHEGDPDLPIILEELGEALNSRFTVSGDIVDINDAIGMQHKALFCTPPDLDISWRLHKLASYYHHRAAKFGEPEYLEEADRFQIAALKSALASTERKEDTIPLILTSVLEVRAASFVHGNYDWGKIEDIVQEQQQILDHFPRDHHARWSLLEVLGKRYTDLFRQSGQLEHIQKAIGAHRESCEAFKAPSNLSSLGSALVLRFGLTKDRVDIEEAITLVTQAIDMGPDNTMLTRLLYLLGEAYAERYSISQDSEDLDQAISHFQSSASSSVGPQGSRLEAAMAWAYHASKKHGPAAALDGLDVAINVITLYGASQDQGVTRRHQRLSTTSFIVLDAAARALRAERVDKALQYLEQGRGVVWRQLHDLRMPVDYPTPENHPLIDRLRTVSRDLDAAERKIRGTFNYDEKFKWLEETPMTQRILFRENEAEYAKIAKEREDLLRTIRETIPDFGRFLLPTSINDWIKLLPDQGAVVVVNVTKSQCDAIILSGWFGEPKHVPLDKLSGEKAKDLQKSLRALLVDSGMLQRSEVIPSTRAIGPPQTKSSPTLSTILRELWLAFVKPVVDALGLRQSETPDRRIWWCPTGPLANLPLHAAGIYRGSSRDDLSRYAVSSYTPTVASLIERLAEKRELPSEANWGVCMVSASKAPGLPPIPGTRREVEAINAQLKGTSISSLRLEEEEATVQATMLAMENYSSIHLACHAAQDTTEPLKSRFHLHDGKLDLSTILNSNLKNADLAFLSACETSVGDTRLSEEVVHLAAGMLAAGYRGVVGTVWSIDDAHAPRVAEEFYKELIKRSGGQTDGNSPVLDGRQAAFALRHAVQQLRERLEDSDSALLSWVPYVHFGL